MLIVAAALFLSASCSDGSGGGAAEPGGDSGASTPLSYTLGEYSPTDYLVNSINASLNDISFGLGGLTTESIELEISGDGTIKVTALSKLEFDGTYTYDPQSAKFVFELTDSYSLGDMFESMAGGFTGEENPLTYTEGELLDATGQPLFAKK